MPSFTTPPSARYLELILKQPLRPIRSEEDLDAASELAGRLATRRRLTADERDYLDVLSTLIEEYEDAHHPVPDVSGVDVLRFLIESNGYTQVTVARGAGIAESVVCEILKGKRDLSRKYIEALARFFHVEPGVFLSTKLPGQKSQ